MNALRLTIMYIYINDVICRRRRTVQTVLPRGRVHRILSAKGPSGGRHAVRPGQVRHLRERRVREGGLRPRVGLGQPVGPVRRVRRQRFQLQTSDGQAQQFTARVLESFAHPGRVVQPGHTATRAQRVQQGRQLLGAGGQRHRRVHPQRQLRVEPVQQGHRVRRHGYRVQRIRRAGRAHQLVQAAQQGRHRRGKAKRLV